MRSLVEARGSVPWEEAMPRKPKPIEMGTLRASVTRGPRDGRWYWRARRKGDRRAVKLVQAWATRQEMQAQLAVLVVEGTPGASLKAEADVTTVQDLLQVYLAHIEDDRIELAESTVESARYRTEPLVRILGRVLVSQLSQVDLHRYIRARIKGEGMKASTVEAQLQQLQRAWRWARPHGLVAGAFPAVALEVPEPEHYRVSFEEIEKVLAWLEGHQRMGFRRCGTVLRVQLLTGARVGEIAGLTVEDVSSERGTLRLDGKTGPRTIPAREAIRVLQRRGLPLLGGVWGVKPRTVSNKVRATLPKAVKACGQPHWTSHALRRFAVDRLVRSGRVDPKVAAAYFGHTVEVMLGKYREPSGQDLMVAASVLEAQPNDAKVLSGPWSER